MSKIALNSSNTLSITVVVLDDSIPKEFDVFDKIRPNAQFFEMILRMHPLIDRLR